MEAPTWFIVLGAIFLVLYILGKIIGIPIKELFLLLTGGQGGCGCLIKSIIGILACILLIWYILTDLF